MPALDGSLRPYPVHSGNKLHIKNHYSANTDPRLNGNVGTKIDTGADEDPRYESFILADGEKKVEVEPETREYTVVT